MKKYKISKLTNSEYLIDNITAPDGADSGIVLTKKELRDILKDIKKVLKED